MVPDSFDSFLLILHLTFVLPKGFPIIPLKDVDEVVIEAVKP